MMPHEIILIRKRVRGGTYLAIGITGFFVVFGFILAAANNFQGTMTFLIAAILIMILFCGILLARGLSVIHRDQDEKMKVCGEFAVDKLIESGRYNTFLYLTVVINGKVKKLQVRQQLYDVIVPREVVYAEFALHSGVLFRLIHQEREMDITFP